MQKHIKNQTGFSALRSNSGFTIVELLVVIVVIGILAAITIVSYTGITKKANEATIQTDLTNASKKLAMYYTQYGEYPHINSSTGCPEAPSTLDTNYCLKFSSGNEFAYTYKTPTTYDLTATKDSITYKVTESTSPISTTALAQPTLPDSDWITIGTQRWAKKNLDVGTMVPGETGEYGGSNATNQTNDAVVEKYCSNNDPANCTTYGGLYQWDEAMQYVTTEGAQGICPASSHIPSDNDWKVLEMQLGMTKAQADLSSAWRGTDQGTQLKTGGVSGLNVPFGGFRDSSSDGSFSDIDMGIDLWSSSQSSSNAWLREMSSFNSKILRGVTGKAAGFTVRCLGN